MAKKRYYTIFKKRWVESRQLRCWTYQNSFRLDSLPVVSLCVFVLAIFNLLRNTIILLQFLLNSSIRWTRSQFYRRWYRCYRVKILRFGLNSVLLCRRNHSGDDWHPNIRLRFLWQLDLPFHVSAKSLDHKWARNQFSKLRSYYTLSCSISCNSTAVVLSFQLVQNIRSVRSVCRTTH